MLIDLENKVIILDEAHNMEDSAREAASLSINHIQISEALKEITELSMLNCSDLQCKPENSMHEGTINYCTHGIIIFHSEAMI